MLISKRKGLCIVLALVVLFSITYTLFSFFAAPNPELTEKKLRIEFNEYQTKKPIEGLPFNLSLVARRNETFHTSAMTGKGGFAIVDVPSNVLSTLPASLSSISLSGVWVLEKIAAKEEFTIADGRWSAVNPQVTVLNMSTYVFDRVSFLPRYNGSALTLELRLFLTKGRTLKMFNPVDEARRFDYRLRIDTVFCNFVEFKGMNLAIVPAEEPLAMNLSLSYLELPLTTHLLLDPGERDFVDLTPSFIRSLSLAQASSLREVLDALEPVGFKLTDLYEKLGRVSDLYELSAQNFEDQDTDSAMKNLVTARNLYRDTYLKTMNSYAGIFGWTPTLVVILIFFSFALSRMLTENRLAAHILFAISLPLALTLFISTQPGFKLLIFNLHFFAQSLATPLFLPFLLLFAQIAIIIVIISVSMLTNIRDLASQVFGVSMRSLRRRRTKTTLALSTIIIVSASAMCLLTFTSVKPTHYVPVYSFSPRVENGLVAYKQIVMRTKPSLFSSTEPTQIVYYEPFQSYEISLFSKDWVDTMSIYGVKTVRLSTLSGFALGNFSTFNLAAVDPGFMEEYVNASEALGVSYLGPADRNMVLIGSRIASRHNLTAGSEVLLDGRRFSVKGVFEEHIAIENLEDLDGSPFLFQIVNPVTKGIAGGSLIFGSIDDFSSHELRIYKISIVAGREHRQNATLIADEILPYGFYLWETEDASFVSSYLIHIISNGSVMAVYSGEPVVALWGDWQANIAPLTIAALLLVTNALGTISERKSEIHTIFTMGASPTRIRFIILMEGVVLGIIGGIFGYVFGYAFAQLTGLALPSLVQQNMISGGPFAISFSIATAASLLGYLLPSGLAVKSAVPSGKISKRMEDMIEVRYGGVSLVVPMKLQLREMRIFDRFLKDLVKSYSTTMYREIFMRQLISEESHDENVWEFAMRCAGGHVSDYQVSILAKPDKDLRVLIVPLDIKKGEPTHWTLEHRQNLKKMAPILRDELLKFIASKKR